MARPKVPSAEKKSIKFTLQLSAAQMQQLNELAQQSGKPAATLAREKIFTSRFPQPRPARIDLEAYTELKAIGRNINQWTKKINSGVISVNYLPVLTSMERQLNVLTAAIVYDR